MGRKRSFQKVLLTVPLVAGPVEYYGKQYQLSALHERQFFDCNFS